MIKPLIKVTTLIVLCIACAPSSTTYKNDLGLLKTQTEVVELTANNGLARIAIAPAFQGKIVNTTFDGVNGIGNAWFKREAFAGYGLNGSEIAGEDRLWIGPLGGQYSFFYQQVKPLSEDNWLVPAPMQSEPFQLVESNEKEVLLQKDMHLINYIGTKFDIEIQRGLKIFEKDEIEKQLNIELDDVKYCAYQSAHTLTNIGRGQHKIDSGLVGLWSLTMLEGTDHAVVIIPIKGKGDLSDINTYLGELNPGRLKMAGSTLLYKADGKYRSKVGIPPQIAPTIFGCYSPERNRLTIVKYNLTNDCFYFNSNPNIQDKPYEGEVIQVYNHGNMDYSQSEINTFVELESTSAMKELKPGETIEHFHRVYHFSGSIDELNNISNKLLKIDLEKAKL